MLKRYAMVTLALMITAAVGWQAYGWLYPVPSNLKLVFHARVGDDAFQRNAFVYQNPGGDGQFRINDFRFFLTNVRLTNGDGQTVTIPDSYHLARFDNADAAYVLQFDELESEANDSHASVEPNRYTSKCRSPLSPEVFGATSVLPVQEILGSVEFESKCIA